MSTLATDDFSTGALITSGGNWSFLEGNNDNLTSGEAVLDGGLWVAVYTTGSAPNNQWAQVKIGSVVCTISDNGSGLIVRGATSAGGDLYFLQANTNETRIYKRVSGGYTQLGSDGPAVASNDVLYFEANGTAITAKKNGTSICGSPITDSGIASGKPGIFGSDGGSTAPRVDDFAFGDFASASVDPGVITGSATVIGAPFLLLS